MTGARQGQREGRKEDDDREVGTASRHRENEEAAARDPHGHVVEEKPRLRGWYSEQGVEDHDTPPPGSDDRSEDA